MTIAELYEIYQAFPNIQTDSRQIKKGDLFFALKGPNFNGNQYAERAIKDGAGYAVVDEPIGTDNPRIIRVTDVLSSLQELAHFHRKTFQIPFIAITGSNGKTTTKELVHAVLSTRYTTYTTKGNLNNHIGVPLTLLSIKRDAQIAVIEMGANHLGEIAGYCDYTEPTIGVITNCGKAHLEGFGSEAGIRKGKGELFDFLRGHGGASFAFADYPYFEAMTKGIAHQYWYSAQTGSQKENMVAVGNIHKSDPFLEIELQRISGSVSVSDTSIETSLLPTQLVGDYNLPNVLCAVALGRYFDIPDAEIQKSIAGYAPSNSRSQLIKKGTNEIILDAYNANPSSMQAAIANFSKMQAASKVLILGGMKELGLESPVEHQKLLTLIQQTGGWQQVILIGPEFESLAGGYHYVWFMDHQSAGEFLQKAHISDSLILIKGSRSNRLENLLEVL